MLMSEMITKTRTKYKTYLEIKVTTKMSDTIWDDSLNVPWEKIENFYAKFGLKWQLNDILLNRKMNFRDRFTFFNFIGPCLEINNTKLKFDLELFNYEGFKYD